MRQRLSVGGSAATYDEAATQRKLAHIDETLVAGSPSDGGSALTERLSRQWHAAGSALVVDSSGVGGTAPATASQWWIRGMRFDCTAEARGRRTHEVKPGAP